MHKRLIREELTIEIMIGIYCCDHHGTKDRLCPDCSELLTYAKARLEKCPFQEKKAACGTCSVHCYKRVMRDRVRDVMRHAGPRMALKHPYLALMHFIDAFRNSKQSGTSGRTK